VGFYCADKNVYFLILQFVLPLIQCEDRTRTIKRYGPSKAIIYICVRRSIQLNFTHKAQRDVPHQNTNDNTWRYYHIYFIFSVPKLHRI